MHVDVILQLMQRLVAVHHWKLPSSCTFFFANSRLSLAKQIVINRLTEQSFPLTFGWMPLGGIICMT